MYVYFCFYKQNKVGNRLAGGISHGKKPKRWNFYKILCFLLFFILLGIILPKLSTEKKIPDHLVINQSGELELSPKRKAKLEKELEEVDNAVQYALYATMNTFYPCLSCPGGEKTIFLRRGELWKIGIARKGKDKRYPNGNFGVKNVIYLEEFYGPLGECVKMEKIKIYNYPLLPEAIRRPIKLIRPPGNAYDN